MEEITEEIISERAPDLPELPENDPETPEQAQERFGYFIDAFKFGTPPHGGLAYGLDRLVMLMAGTTNIRDVIAFPKVQTAACLMTDAPNVVEEKQLRELHIRTDLDA